MNSVLLVEARPRTIYTNTPELVTGETLTLQETKQNYQLNLTQSQSLTISTASLSSKAQIYGIKFNLTVISTGVNVLTLLGCNIPSIIALEETIKINFSKNPNDENWTVTRQEAAIDPLYLVPIMTSNSQDGYITSASSEYDSAYQAWKAFNRTTDEWATSNNNKSDGSGYCTAWLEVQMPTANIANAIQIVSRAGAAQPQTPKSFKVQGSNDGSEWTDLCTQTDVANYTNQTWNFENLTKYSYYRLYVTRTFGTNTNIGVSQCNFMLYR